jgi:hypothetical protein
MIDTTNHRPLHVSAYGGAAPYIIVPMTQLDQVKAVLDANAVRYWVDDEALSVDGKPWRTFVNLGQETSPAFVQGLLDSIA